LATHQNPHISGLFLKYELLIDEKYELKFAKRSIKLLPKTLCLSQNTITPPSKTKRIAHAEETLSHRCTAARAQASLILSIPNYLLSRQGKSLDNTQVSTLLTVLMAHHIFVLRASDHQKLLDRSHQLVRTRRALSRTRSTPKRIHFSELKRTSLYNQKARYLPIQLQQLV
jgi:hypothetical protein